jgi:tetratricopeptide (TPR) repeat protein
LTGHAKELEQRGLAAYRRGDLAAASADLEAARLAYASSGDDLKAAEMANNLCVVLVGLGHADEAVSIVQGTEEVFARAGDARRAAQAAGNLAAALEAAGDLERAASAYQRAWTACTPPASTLVADVASALTTPAAPRRSPGGRRFGPSGARLEPEPRAAAAFP